MQLCTPPPRVSVMPKIMGKTSLEFVAIKSMGNFELKKTLCMYLPSCWKHATCTTKRQLHSFAKCYSAGTSCILFIGKYDQRVSKYDSGHLFRIFILYVHKSWQGHSCGTHIGYILIKGSPNQVIFEYFGVKLWLVIYAVFDEARLRFKHNYSG